MKAKWKLRDAKAQFSKVVEEAFSSGPQFITCKRGKQVVVLSVKEYEKLVPVKPDFRKLLLSCPKVDEDFTIERKQDLPREIDF